LANVVLGTTNAQIDCSGGAPPNETWTTGGGWIPVGLSKGTFGVSGGIKNSDFVGHLVYQDHGIGLRIKDTAITNVVSGSCETTIVGTGQTDEGQVQFDVTVRDGGAGGASDTFFIHATFAYPAPEYFAGPAFLGGGNIKVHDQPCS
jgi:hypothetical protein